MCTKENIRSYSYCGSLSVGDPDPQDPHVFGPPGFGSIIIKGQCQEIIDKVFFHESVQEQNL